MKLVGSSCLFIFAVYCAVANGSATPNSTFTVTGVHCATGYQCHHSVGYYWCYTDADTHAWEYCCLPNSKCGTDEQYQYDWCWHTPISSRVTTAGSWSYCNRPKEESRHKTISGDSCSKDSYCGHHGKRYNWCLIDNNWAWANWRGWDYCCLHHHSCGKNGKSWCWVGYYRRKACAGESHSDTETVDGDTCVGKPCGKHDGYTYNWCSTSEKSWFTGYATWDYCCRPDHMCAKHGNSYNWCYTSDKSDWDYCTP